MSDIFQDYNANEQIELSIASNQNRTSLESLLGVILKELLERKDEGKAIYNKGTLSSTVFTILDTTEIPGNPVKGYTIRNTDTINSIYVAHNIAKNIKADIDISDSLKSNPIFTTLLPGEGENIIYNTKCIRSIHLLAVAGTATYKIKLIW